MTYDPNTRTITIERNNAAQLQLDHMIWAVDTMGRLLLERGKDASDSIKRDGGVIFSWLGQEIGPLTPSSVTKIKLGILGYVSALGQLVPMLAQLLPMLDDLKNNFPTFEPPLKVPVPVEVMEAFDRLFADEKLAEKRRQDGFFRKQEMERTFSRLTKKKPTGMDDLLARVHQLSDFTKLFLVVTGVWILWVWLRTATEFQLVGYYFEQWRTNMVVPNLVVVPVLLLVGRYVYTHYMLRKYRSTQATHVADREARYAEEVTDCIREMGDRGDIALHAQLYPDFLAASFEVCKAGFECNVPARHVAGFISEAAASYQSNQNVAVKLLEYARARIPQLWPHNGRHSRD